MSYQLTPLQPKTQSLKVQADEAFVASKFKAAIRLYSEAIALQPEAEVLYSNRSGSSLLNGDARGALADADKAIKLAPGWFRAHSRRAAALADLGRTMGAIISMRTSLQIHEDPENRKRLDSYFATLMALKHLSKPARSRDDLTDPSNFGRDLLLAHTTARDISLPTTSSTATLRHALVAHVEANPDWEQPIRRALYLPSRSPNDPSSDVPTRQLACDYSIGETMRHESILECIATDSEFLYHEDGAEKLRGNAKGVGIGYTYRVWQVIMDDNANADRHPNAQASEILQRPNLHGPVLVLKTLHIKTHNAAESDLAPGTEQDVAAWELVALDELQSTEWQERRAEFVELVARSADREMARMMGDSGNSVTETRFG